MNATNILALLVRQNIETNPGPENYEHNVSVRAFNRHPAERGHFTKLGPLVPLLPLLPHKQELDMAFARPKYKIKNKK